MQVCYDCATRTREFPFSEEQENGSFLHGKICKICDRKFLMYQNYNKSIEPALQGEAAMQHHVQRYEHQLSTANTSITETERLEQELLQTHNDNKLKMMQVD